MRRRSLLLATVLALVAATNPAGATPRSEAAPSEPVRISADIGGQSVQMEVRNLPAADAALAIRQAIGTLAAVRESLSGRAPDSRVSQINAAAGKGLQPVDPGTGELLGRALGYCVWSQGAEGPLGGSLYDLWEHSEHPPAGPDLETAVEAAACHNLRPEAERWSLAAGSRLDLRHFAAGYAVDRAMQDLLDAGATNAWIEYGAVVRALGDGPEGRGWKFVPPLFPGMVEGLEPLWLHDRALAIASAQRDRFRFGDLSYPPYLDQRSGRPTQGVIAVLVASELAADAQALASAMMVLGNREGQFRLGTVDPAPSVLWLLGDGSGPPLITTKNWSPLRR